MSNFTVPLTSLTASEGVSVHQNAPGAPTNIIVTQLSSTSVSIAFTAPSDNGYPITQYQVASTPGNIIATGASSPITVTGLTTYQSYVFSVKASNEYGYGVASDFSASITLATAPVAPTNIVVSNTALNTQSISFDASFPNGATVTQYTVTRNDGATATGANSPIVFSDLVNGNSYSYTVTATNRIGNSPASVTTTSKISTKEEHDPYYEYLVLGCHYNNSFADVKSHTPREYNGTVFNTTSPTPKFGSHCLKITTNQFVTYNSYTDYIFGTDDFTAECWIYQTATGATQAFLGTAFSNDGQGFYLLTNAGKLTIHVGASGAWSINTSGTTTIPLNQWNHVALVRSGTSVKAYLNGILEITGTLTSGFALTNTNNGIQVGGRSISSQWFDGFIDEVRVYKGVAKYLSNFYPSSTAYADVAASDLVLPIDQYADNVVLGCHLDGSLTDVSGKTLTNNNVYFERNSAQFGTPSPSYLNLVKGQSFGSGDWTIEGWFKPTTYSGYHIFYCDRVNGSGIGGIWTTFNSNGNMYIYASSNNSSWDIFNNSTIPCSLTLNTWQHIALVRKGTTITLYKNGVSTGSLSIGASTSFYNSTSLNAKIGGEGDFTNPFYGNIAEFRITKGFARYQTPFTPKQSLPTGGYTSVCDPYYEYVTALLDFEGTDGSISFVDAKGHTITSSNATIKNTAYKYGSTSCYLNSGYVSMNNADFTLGTSAFTIEGWYNISAHNDRALFDGAGVRIGVLADAANQRRIYVNGAATLQVAGAFPLNTWFHLAVTRDSGNVVRLFQDGVMIGSYTDATNLTATTFTIGGGIYNNMLGYVDDFRITRGYARYTANFTVATTPCNATAVPNNEDPLLSLNTHLIPLTKDYTDYMGNAITDKSVALKLPQISKFGGQSAYFNGAAYATVPMSSDFQFGSGDFTIETWIYPTSVTGIQNIISPWLSGVTGERGWQLYLNGASVSLDLASGATKYTTVTGPFNITTNTWYHIAVSRIGGTATVYVNGQPGTAVTGIGSLDTNNQPVCIGAYWNAIGTPAYYFTGYLDDLRITKGVGRYSSSFACPTQPFTVRKVQPATGSDAALPVIATGGQVTTINGYTIHRFTGSTKLTVINSGKVDILIVAGGGGGGMDMGGGGGGGGVVTKLNQVLSAGTYNITVGAGGAGGPAAGTYGNTGAHQYILPARNGENSVFDTFSATGGGFGGSSHYPYTPGAAGNAGGSGGGASGYSDGGTRAGGAGTSGQGYAGGQGGGQYYSGGGGGAGGAGTNSTVRADGGIGALNSFIGVATYWSGGGGGSGYSIGGGYGGQGGGGGGAVGTAYGGIGLTTGYSGGGGGTNSQANCPGGFGATNTGGGGGGGSHYQGNNKGGDGGSGIVIVRYLTDAQVLPAPSNPSVTNTGVGIQTVTFTAPVADNISSLTNYSVLTQPGNILTVGTTNTVVAVSGLANGTTYTHVVMANNPVGSSPVSSTTTPLKTWDVPVTAPTNVTVTNTAIGEQTISFTAPTNPGATAITLYTAVSNDNRIFTSATTSIVATGLPNGASFTWSVYSTNSYGNGPASVASSSVTTWSVPTVPTSVVVTDDVENKVKVAFGAPTSNGGQAVTGYTVRCVAANIEVQSATSPVIISGLTLGTSYTFEVAANNSVGTGAFATASPITPVNPVTVSNYGDNSFTVTVPANTDVADIFYALDAKIINYGWEVWDPVSHVYRALNKNGSYKYMRISVSGTTNIIALTDAWESWDKNAHTGTNRAGPAVAGQTNNDYTKTGFYLNSSSQQTVIYVFANPRWLFISSSVGGGRMGSVFSGAGNNYSYGPNDYASPTVNTFYGVGGVTEFEIDGQTANATPFMWTHTGWASQTNDSIYSNELTRMDAVRSAWEAPRSNVIGKCPRTPTGATNVDVKLMTNQIYSIDQARINTDDFPTNSLWNNRRYVLDMGASCEGNPIGQIYGLKLAKSTGSPLTSLSNMLLKVDSNYFLSREATVTTQFVYLDTNVNVSCSYTRYQITSSGYYETGTWKYSGCGASGSTVYANSPSTLNPNLPNNFPWPQWQYYESWFVGRDAGCNTQTYARWWYNYMQLAYYENWGWVNHPEWANTWNYAPAFYLPK